MRLLHRYTGYFMAGIMVVYAFTGFVLLFRGTDFLKVNNAIEIQLPTHLNKRQLEQNVAENDDLWLRQFKIIAAKNGILTFSKNRYNSEGSYDSNTGLMTFTRKEYPVFITQLIKLHKAKIENPLSAFNILFAVSLFFFVLSSLWMFPIKSQIFKKGALLIGSGILLGSILLFFV